MDLQDFLKQFEQTFGPEMAQGVKRELYKNTGKELAEMAVNMGNKSKALYAVFVVDQEADTAGQPDYVIATSEENARYKVLHNKDVADPETLDVFVQRIGTLKSED